MTPFLRLLVYLTADDCGKEVQMKGTPRKLTMLHARGYDYNRNVPSVLLSGLLLKDCGFASGDRVTVKKAEDGKIVVTKEM